ncbi:MAG: cobyric acid synthase, partial [Planctomycetota bacterium]|nr:cobyric acid synthase [Planctomycetota bacterium]
MARAIMIQGTASSVGKSLIAAGLCRVFRQDGHSVAPFKSQNMALNSFITREGLEMGRAQVVQAEAAGVEPSVLMNPILLKPTGDSASQVIVNGEVVGNMGAADYYRRRPEFLPAVRSAYLELAARHDILVIEGAGSPAEINLGENDLVNMGMAALAGAPVLLVGDIDRGGVFASLYGTAALLPPEDRQRIRGLVVNKFRGDPELLRPGLVELERLLGIPVLGVVPWLSVDLDDEDSVSRRLENKTVRKPVAVAVIRLPRLANFTDFAALGRHPALGVRYVAGTRELGRPDLLIVPGSKNTMGDLAWMRANGLEAAIKRLAAAGTPILGICGGFQMLGRSLADPEGVELGGEMRGMELLPVATVFSRRKKRTRVAGRVNRLIGFFAGLSGAEFAGYEIHSGETRSLEEERPFAFL